MNSRIAAGYVRVRILGHDQLVEDRMVRLQTQRIMRECDRLGWGLDELFVDRGPGGLDPGHPGLSAALDLVRQGRHAALVVSVFDRLARPDAELHALFSLAGAEGWELVVAR